MSSSCEKKTKNYDIFSFCILTLLTLLGYSNTLSNEFACDDITHIVSNIKVIANFPIYSFLLEPISPGNLYRPLVQISYAVTHQLFGLNSFIFHLTNIIAHLLCSLLVYKLFLIITTKKRALISASFFVLLPIHSEVIANISGRYELFSAFFSLTAILIFFKEKNKEDFLEYFCLSFIYLLALLSKENAVTVLGIIILLNVFTNKSFDYLFIKRFSALLLSLFLY